MALLERYIAGWRAHDISAILDTLTPECIVIESFGPIYRGHDSVTLWVSTWLSQAGRVIDWTVVDVRSLLDGEVAEWKFRYAWRGEEKNFDGATITKSKDNRISYLREYATTDFLYDWQGEWRPLK